MKKHLALCLLLLWACPPLAAQPTAPVRATSSTIKGLARLEAMQRSGKIHLTGSTPEQQRVDRIGQKVAAQCRRPVPWVFYVCTDKTPNAFTLGEGVVVVTRGLLDLNLDDDELAGVLAHEVAHGSQQHLEFADLRNQRAAQATSDTYAINQEARKLERDRRSGRISDDVYETQMYHLKRRAEEVNQQASAVISQARFFRQLSQEQEVEADVWGLRYAIAAGYSQDGLEHALQKLLTAGKSIFGESFNGEGLTHPSIARRIDVLHRVEASMARSAARS